jgi:hypothetical protein
MSAASGTGWRRASAVWWAGWWRPSWRSPCSSRASSSFESLRDVADSNEAAREALAAIAKHRDEYLEAKERMMTQEARIGTEPPQFAADLEAAAQRGGDRHPGDAGTASAPVGRRYVEHKVDVKLRQVDLQSLTKFLNKLETGRRLIMVNSLRVRKRFSDPGQARRRLHRDGLRAHQGERQATAAAGRREAVKLSLSPERLRRLRGSACACSSAWWCS